MGIRTVDQLRQRNRELSLLNTVAQALNGTLEIKEALQVVLAQAAELFGLETGWVWLLREDLDHAGSAESYLAASQNLPPGLANHPARMEGSCYCLSTYRKGDLKGAANVNVVQCSRLEDLVDGTNGLAYHASIPINAHGKKLGILNLASTDWRELSAEDLRLFYTIGDMLGIAIERNRLVQQSRHLGVLQERNRLAREIHDTLAQGLTGVALQLESAETLLELKANPSRILQTIRKALNLTRHNLDEARRSVLDLRAAPLESRSLPQALRDLCNSLPIDVILNMIGENRPLSPRLEIGLYRIAQEALNNAVQHAQADRVSLTLTHTPSEITLLIADDGLGFDVSDIPTQRFGLVGLNERVRLLGGNLQISSTLGEGTNLQVTIPLEQEQPWRFES